MSFADTWRAQRFARHLGDYYEDLASWLEQSKDLRLLDVFTLDAQRFQGTPRGVLSAIWADRYQETGANLAQTWDGFLPADDIAVIRAQQDQGSQALVGALRDLARTSRIKSHMRQATLATVGLGVLALLIAALSASVLPIWAVAILRDAIRVPTEQWGEVGRGLASWAGFVVSWGGWLAFGVLALVAWVVHSLQTWTGAGRDWADRHLLVYRIHHEIHAMKLALVMATLTRKNSSTMLTLRNALDTLSASTSAPWQSWQLQRLIERIDSGNAHDSEVFNTGVFPRPMFWRLQDLTRSHALSDAFTKLADVVEALWLPRLVRSLTYWRWVLLLLAVIAMVLLVACIQISTAEMKDAVMNSLSR